jgi:hypothetical protein
MLPIKADVRDNQSEKKLVKRLLFVCLSELPSKRGAEGANDRLWHIASFRCRAALPSLSGRGGPAIDRIMRRFWHRAARCVACLQLSMTCASLRVAAKRAEREAR